MRIGVNARLMIEGKMDGIGWFASESLRCMVAAHPGDTFVFFFDRKPSPAFLFADNVQSVVLHPPARHPILWCIFFEWSLWRALRRHRIDVLLSPDGYLPLRCHIPTLAVIHDLNFEHAKGNLRPSHQWYMKHFFPRFARCATRVATVSEYSRRDIASTYHIPLNKIDVVYDGAHAAYRPRTEDENRSTRSRYTAGAHYIIFISTILKRKNLSTLLTAFDRVRDRHDIRLVVVGSRVWWQDELKDAYDAMAHAADVLFLGHADTSELSLLLSAADALVYPSLFEGFGIPVLEAFYAETAVIASNTTSIPEVAGDAALLVDPRDVGAIADAIERLLLSPSLRDELIQRGRRQRTLFSWQRTASLLWQSLQQTIAVR
ncbi:MAG: a-glycosyltransferase [bacterium P3]|nr:MAG: a-glycosyltransferase [bacterium P3]KWW41004.1 MAG: a-glycosyltransferase [bacterium F083]